MRPVAEHFQGTIRKPAWQQPAGRLIPAPALDLKIMAQRAMNYFLRTPMPQLNWACRFGNDLSACPPWRFEEDLVAHGDTDVRMASAMPGLRELSGLTAEPQVEAGLSRRIMSYVGGDDLSHTPFAAACSADLPPETMITSLWASGLTIRMLTDQWLQTGQDELREKAGKMAAALLKLARWQAASAYYPGWALLRGEWIGGVFGKDATLPTPVTCDLLHYGLACGDREIVEFAAALARGIAAGLPGAGVLGPRRFRADGSFTDHTHLHTRIIWGVAMAGRVMNDPALIEWARRGYEFVRARGTDFGWFPERMVLPGEHPHDGLEERVNVSETCITGDMIQTAAELAHAGYPHYWDHVERYVKNYLKESQFALTPEIAEFYTRGNAALPAEAVKKGLAMLRDYEGGFFSDFSVNDLTGVMAPLGMAGCCVPEGARALVTAWRNVAVRGEDGISVNMAFTSEGRCADVMELADGMRLTAREEGRYYLRPPAWTERSGVQALRNGAPVEAEWQGDYLRFENLRRGEILEIAWPLASFTQAVKVGGKLGAEYAYRIQWQGNQVTGINPVGTVLPLFKKVSGD